MEVYLASHCHHISKVFHPNSSRSVCLEGNNLLSFYSCVILWGGIVDLRMCSMKYWTHPGLTASDYFDETAVTVV